MSKKRNKPTILSNKYVFVKHLNELKIKINNASISTHKSLKNLTIKIIG